MLVTLSLLCTIAPPVLPVPQVTRADLVEALVLEGDLFQSGGATYEVDTIDALVSGVDGGWVAVVRDFSPTASAVSFLVGQRPGSIGGPVELLRAPADLSGIRQSGLLYPSMANGRIAYVADGPEGDQLGDSVWIDDQLLASNGDPIAGSGGWTWSRFDQCSLGSNGRVVAVGLGLDPQGLGPYFLVADVTGEALLLNGRDFFPGVPRRIGGLKVPFQQSPNGQHWVAQIQQFFSGKGAVIVNGALFEVEPGFPVVQDAPLPPTLSAAVAPGTWIRLDTGVSIDDGGRVTFGGGGSFAGIGFHSVIMRGDRPALVAEGGADRWFLAGVARNGAITWTDGDYQGRVSVENQEVMTLVPHVDMDRDGVAEPGMYFASYYREDIHAGEEGLLVALGEIDRLTGGFGMKAIVQARLTQVDMTVCEGLPNSTGRAGRILAAGSPLAGDNELSLQLFDLPGASRGYVLLSRTSGPATQPGGSQGTLCLGGAIGRLQSGLYLVGSSGAAAVNLDLMNLPQPAGPAAAMAGETWFAQGWHRDSVGGMSTSNFTNAIAVDFR